MRKRFEFQKSIGQTSISEIYLHPKSKNSLEQLIAALECNSNCRECIPLDSSFHCVPFGMTGIRKEKD